MEASGDYNRGMTSLSDVQPAPVGEFMASYGANELFKSDGTGKSN